LAAALSQKIDILHVLVNNSGFTWGQELSKFEEKGWDRVMDLNLKSVFFLTQALLPLIKAAARKEDPARIINIGSVAGIVPQVHPTYSYDASKAALHFLTKKLAKDLAKDNITVNVIAPGFIPSKMSAQFKMDPQILEKTIPLSRVGKPSDMAGVAIFLASPISSYITGSVIPVDGGIGIASAWRASL